MLKDLIDTYEELKKYVFVINRGGKGMIVLKFNNENFYHLIGLHKINIDMFIPSTIKSKDKKYKYIKKNIEKFENILQNQIKEKTLLELRITTFPKILDLLNENINTSLFDLHLHDPNSMYDGDYGLLKVYEKVNCLLGLKIDNIENNTVFCAPQSWMASRRINKLVENKRQIYKDNIIAIPLSLYNKNE